MVSFMQILLNLDTCVNNLQKSLIIVFLVTLMVISRSLWFKYLKSRHFVDFSNFVILLLAFSYCLTVALKWYTSFKCTIESSYLCYYVTSLKKIKKIDLSGKRKGKIISRSFKYRTTNIMSSLRFLSVVVLELL